MSDGSINNSDKNPHLQVATTNRQYADKLDNEFGVLSTGVHKGRTAEECAKDMRERGMRPEASSENYNDVFRWSTRNIPEISQYRDWYSSGNKVWPVDVNLDPLTLKHLYYGDGSLTNGRLRIAMFKERENSQKVQKYFDDCGLPTPTFTGGSRSFEATFTKSQTTELFDYMGEPIEGFKYKWP